MPYYNRDPKRDHNFDNHPYVLERRSRGLLSVYKTQAAAEKLPIDVDDASRDAYGAYDGT